MAGIKQAAREREEGFFVGRSRELAAFYDWLRAEPPALLNISGPAGIGKSALVAALTRAAVDAGRKVVSVDGRELLPRPADLVSALGGRTLDDAVAGLNRSRPLVVIDAFEQIAGLTGFLREELLAGVDSEVRLVVAGRHPLGAIWRADEPWPVSIQSLTLERLAPADSLEYLKRRGVDSELAPQLVDGCGGWPLALSLGADLIEQFGIRRLPAAPEWHLAVRGLVDRLMGESGEATLRPLLEAGAIIRQFDEETLAALTTERVASAGFAALCGLSIVRPTERGLALHDYIRKMVSDDLRWRRPERHAELRVRALGYYRERASRAPPQERERLLEERLFLWEHEIVSSMLYVGDEPGDVWVEPARPSDGEALLTLHRRWQTEVHPALDLTMRGVEWDAEGHFSWFERLVKDPRSRVRIARDRAGAAIGYNVVLPVCEETLALARGHDVIGGTVDAYLGLSEIPPLSATAREADLVFLAHLGLSGDDAEAGRAALVRDFLSVLARGGACLCSLDLEDYRRLAEALGFQPVPDSEVVFRGAEYRGYALDLRRVGAEPWLEALLGGGPRPPVGPGELERELHQVLTDWHDDAQVAPSTLAAFAGPAEAGRPEAIRSVVEAAFNHAMETSPPSQRSALRAVEIGYLQRTMSHEHAAEELNVSRATFYRLLQRGTALVSDALPVAAERLRRV